MGRHRLCAGRHRDLPAPGHVDEPDIQLLSAEFDTPNAVRFEYATTGNPGDFSVGLYRSADEHFDPLIDVPVPVLSPTTVTPGPLGRQSPVTLTIAPARAGSALPYLLVVADPPDPAHPEGQIAESNEGNNTAAIKLVDLAVDEDTGLVWNTRRGALGLSPQRGVDVTYGS